MRNKKPMLVLISFILLLSMLAGCGKKEPEKVSGETGTVVFQYGDNIVTKGEVYIYICTVRDRYELQYGEDVWQLSLPDDNGNDISMVDLTRQEVVEEIVNVKTLAAHAGELDVSLSDAQIAEIESDAGEFYKGLTDDDKSQMELTEDKVVQVMSENALADAVEAKILEDNPVEISDEQARMTTFYDMYFECYTIDENGAVIPYSSEDRQKQYENALQACSTLATASIDEDADAENIEKLAEYYKLSQAKEQTLASADILETYGEDIYNMLYSMKNGDYSTVIESEYGYHVFQMIALTDQKATNGRKETMRQEEIKKQLADKIEKWQKDIDANFIYPDSVNMDVYDSISLQ